MLQAMKRAQITSLPREAYGLVLEESERGLRPLRSGPPQNRKGPAAGLPRGGAGLRLLDLALLALLASSVVGFWILVGKLLVRVGALLVALLG
jgi:hypothetical protein